MTLAVALLLVTVLITAVTAAITGSLRLVENMLVMAGYWLRERWRGAGRIVKRWLRR